MVITIRPGVLDSLRVKHKITSDEQFAELLGVSRQTFIRVASGKVPPSPYFMGGLVKFSRMSIQRLFEAVPVGVAA